ncbi:hypothetical protein [Streptomyces sp. NRRL S-350]|nr:hypothetical protein [Streptomyces sp. NRRL S-350]
MGKERSTTNCPDADNDGHWDDVYAVTVHGPHRVALLALHGGAA